MKEIRIDLKVKEDLLKDYDCPSCGKVLKHPECKCEICGVQLIFYLPV